MEPRLVVIGIGSPLSIISPRELERLHHLLDNRACDLVSADPEYHLAGDRYILDRAVGVFDSAEDRAGDPEPIEVPYRQVVKQRPCPRPGIASLPPVFLFTLLLLAPVFGNPPPYLRVKSFKALRYGNAPNCRCGRLDCGPNRGRSFHSGWCRLNVDPARHIVRPSGELECDDRFPATFLAQ